MRARHWFGGIVVLSTLAFAPPARACHECESRAPTERTDRSIWPHPGMTAIASVGVGACWRQDPLVPGSGTCGDFFIGIDAPIPGRFRLTLEGGVVQTVRAQTGPVLPFNGTSHVSGGTYFATRFFIGYDWTRLFFMRLGWELHATAETELAEMWLAEMGTRIFGHLEVGLRAKLGFEGVRSQTFTSGRDESGHGIAFAQGVLVFVRAFK